MSTPDPLQSLFVSESQAIDRQQLATLLSPYLAINKETGAFDFSSQFRDLPNAEMILLVLSAVKARSLVLKSMVDEISPSEIIKMEIMPLGSVKGTLKILLDARDIKSTNGKYSVPNYKIPQVVARFNQMKQPK
ncbi:MAG: hypothetical protein WA021_02235 [Minisyncoccia bacterium]